MINVKLVVIFTCVDIVFGNSYCKICSQHTLCKYTMPGPSMSCKLYDKAGLLSEKEIKEIIKKLNERRNYVAMGYSKFLPAAANMRKIFWSEELATFAQRWVDQCDQSLWPDKEDQCRNLKSTSVGQNIATVAGATSAFNVKNLVDTWFMRTLDYTGSVSYYNQSRDSRTRYFTQMIWADSGLVGCGRARFYVDHKSSMVERLVCNFAPQGNIHGKPVYAIGYPATQCPDDTRPDENYKGLCSRYTEPTIHVSNATKYTPPSPKVSSLLRILNLSNNSAKQAIDPIRHNLKTFTPNANKSIEQRSQKIRHIENNTYDSFGTGAKHMNHMNPIQMTTLRFNHKFMSIAQDEEQIHHPERGHSRVYHHHLHNIEQTTTPSITLQVFRRFNYVSDIQSGGNSPDFRQYNPSYQCTRKDEAAPYVTERYDLRMPYIQSECTRGSNKDCGQTHPSCNDHTSCPDEFHRELCSCNILLYTCTTAVPVPTRCMCNLNCQCQYHPTTGCTDHLRGQGTFSDDTRKAASILDYYDQIPNIGIRSGGKHRENHKSNYKTFSFNKRGKMKNNASVQSESLPATILTRRYKFHRNDRNYKNINDYKDSYNEYLDNDYKKLNFHQRNRRNVAEELTFKPFWQMDEVTLKKSAELKSLRYTTLSNKKKNIKYKKPSLITEPITFKLSENKESSRKIVTEKYLSFDELMHLRKIGETNIDVYDARRVATKTTAKAAATTAKAGATTAKAGATTAKKAAATTAKVKTTEKATTKSTTEVTANTQFERKKHCTRKLTCTWTAISLTDSAGSVIGGQQLEAGSLTPPGYVEGCTRTFTCTRIDLNKNKFSTLGDREDTSEGEGEEETALHGDEDYCEKRALDIRRRNSNEEYFNGHATSNTASQIPSTISHENYEISTETIQYVHSHESNTENDCSCNQENLRVKRDEIHNNDNDNSDMRETLSYGDLYYRVLQKVLSGWRKYHPSNKHKCACSYGCRNSVDHVMFLYLTYIFFAY